jgi:AcrR family transcriptional regulator
VGTRRYDMRARSRALDATKASAVKAAYEMLLDPKCRELGLEAVAARVGVTRVTLYNQFGSRTGLLLALFAELGKRIGAERIHVAMRLPDPVEAMMKTIQESTRGLKREQHAVRKLFAFAALDATVQSEVTRAEQARRASLLHLAKRLSDAQPLRLGVREAAALLAGLTSFQAFEAFAFEAGPRLVEQRLLHIACTSLGISAHEREAE